MRATEGHAFERPGRVVVGDCDSGAIGPNWPNQVAQFILEFSRCNTAYDAQAATSARCTLQHLRRGTYLLHQRTQTCPVAPRFILRPMRARRSFAT